MINQTKVHDSFLPFFSSDPNKAKVLSNGLLGLNNRRPIEPKDGLNRVKARAGHRLTSGPEPNPILVGAAQIHSKDLLLFSMFKNKNMKYFKTPSYLYFKNLLCKFSIHIFFK